MPPRVPKPLASNPSKSLHAPKPSKPTCTSKSSKSTHASSALVQAGIGSEEPLPPRAVDRFHSTDLQTRHDNVVSKRSVFLEREFLMSVCGDEFNNIIDKRQLSSLVGHVDEANIPIVHEFYTDFPQKSFEDNVYEVPVREKVVALSPEAIRLALDLPMCAPDSYDVCNTLISKMTKHDLIKFLYRKPDRFLDLRGPLRNGRLKELHRTIFFVVRTNIWPTSNKSDISDTHGALIHLITQLEVEIPVHELIFHKIVNAASNRTNKTNVSLPFGCLITRLAGQMPQPGDARNPPPATVTKTILKLSLSRCEPDSDEEATDHDSGNEAAGDLSRDNALLKHLIHQHFQELRAYCDGRFDKLESMLLEQHTYFDGRLHESSSQLKEVARSFGHLPL